MTAARVRVRLKGTRVYLLAPVHSEDVSDLLVAAREALRHPVRAWALVAFWPEGRRHASFCRYYWPVEAGPVHALPGAVAERLRELVFA